MTNRELATAIFTQAIEGKIGIDEMPEFIEIGDNEYDTDDLPELIYIEMVDMLKEFNTSHESDWYEIQKKWIKIINSYK